MSDMMVICSTHREEYPTPLIFTFAFIYAEYWCPYCGRKSGMFDGGHLRLSDDLPASMVETLQKRHDKFLKLAMPFMEAAGVRVCSSLEWPKGSGQQVKPRDLPSDVRAEFKRVADRGFPRWLKVENVPDDITPAEFEVFYYGGEVITP